MNRQDVEMVQNALQNLGQGALQRRQMEMQHQEAMQRTALESQLRDIQQGRYDAQTAHYQAMEDKYEGANENNAERNQILAQSEADKTRIEEQGKQAAQDFANAKDGLTNFTQTLKANRTLNQQDPTKGMSQPDAVKAFQGAMDSMPQALHDQMLQNPQYSSLYKGQVDFATVPGVDAKGNPIPTPGSAQLTTLKDPSGATATGVQDAHGNWHPSAATATRDPVRDELVAKQVAASLPENGSSTNAPYAASQYDLLTKPPAAGGPGLPGAPAGTAAAPAMQPPPAHVAYLMQHPEAAPQFDAKYGAGASQRYLQSQQQQQPIPGGGGFQIGLPGQPAPPPPPQ